MHPISSVILPAAHFGLFCGKQTFPPRASSLLFPRDSLLHFTFVSHFPSIFACGGLSLSPNPAVLKLRRGSSGSHMLIFFPRRHQPACYFGEISAAKEECYSNFCRERAMLHKNAHKKNAGNHSPVSGASSRPDSNWRPAHYECAALPTEPRKQVTGAFTRPLALLYTKP